MSENPHQSRSLQEHCEYGRIFFPQYQQKPDPQFCFALTTLGVLFVERRQDGSWGNTIMKLLDPVLIKSFGHTEKSKIIKINLGLYCSKREDGQRFMDLSLDRHRVLTHGFLEEVLAALGSHFLPQVCRKKLDKENGFTLLQDFFMALSPNDVMCPEEIAEAKKMIIRYA